MEIDGETMETVRNYFLGLQITTNGDCYHEIKRCLLLERKTMTDLRQHIKKQRLYFADRGPCSQIYGFSSSHVWMWELDHKESWAPKNWYFWTVVLEKTIDSPLDCKDVKLVHPKGNQPWIFTERTEAEALVHWPPDAKSQLFATPWTIQSMEFSRLEYWSR